MGTLELSHRDAVDLAERYLTQEERHQKQKVQFKHIFERAVVGPALAVTGGATSGIIMATYPDARVFGIAPLDTTLGVALYAFAETPYAKGIESEVHHYSNGMLAVSAARWTAGIVLQVKKKIAEAKAKQAGTAPPAAASGGHHLPHHHHVHGAGPASDIERQIVDMPVAA